MASTPAREWALKLKHAQDGTNEAARLEFAKDYTAAFSTYVRTGETYLWLIRQFHQRQRAGSTEGDEELKARLRKAASKVLERAELIRSLRKDIVVPPRDILSPDAQAAVLYRSSTVGAHSYPLWDAASIPALDGPRFSDSEDQPALASSHLERSAQFRRASETAGSPQLIDYESPLRGRDIVQDVVTDCSFVAALQVAAEYDRRWSSKIATAALHPRDAQDRACLNGRGKYAVKLYFNGGARQVVVDDKLPCFPDGTLIGAAAVRNDQFWPALVEKAFLKVMGGYDFPGSNSAADLHTLTGWLPEQVLLQQAGFRREQTWHALHTAFVHGRCILTVGTGANTLSRPRDKSWKWLSPAHNYAVLDLREHEGHRQVVVVNSWRRAPSVVEALSERTESLSLGAGPSSSQERDDEVHVLSWEDICMRFDTIHVNWRLSDFARSETVHCAWDSRIEQLSLSQNMQLQILFDWSGRKGGEGTAEASTTTSDNGEELWLHLNRHMTGSSEPESALIAVHAFNHTDGRKLYQLTDREQMGAFTDSSHALHKMRIRPDCQAVTVIASQYGVNRETSFSLSAYGSIPMTIRALPRAYANRVTTSGSWSGRSAGGNLAQPTFGFNPQYVLETEDTNSNAAADASLLIMAETARMVPLQIMLVHSRGGQRVEQVEEPEVIMSSGMYTHAVAIAERKADGSTSTSSSSLPSPARSPLPRQRSGVSPGKYTLIVSTFAPGVEGDFFLTIESSHRIAAIRPIPQEGAGMFHRALREQWSIERGTAAGGPTGGLYFQNPCWKVVVPVGGATIQMRLRLDTNDTSISTRLPFQANSDLAVNAARGRGQQTRPPLNLAIFRLNSLPLGKDGQNADAPSDSGQRSDARVLIAAIKAPVLPKASEVTSSGPYADRLHGVAIGRRRLEAGEYVLVASTFNTGQEASFVVEVWSETGLEVK
ncbi:unnamed protein product [Tilletia controversa]|uniref:Calpain catalytic domain-containing protein n=3 Tax=Tilletia TaxID=13289 RepID=A0A8X7MPY8_9BASI|nr:hypothetical protein CF335_g2525 [Tilletia laevis]KAE8245132.1 hypothetical protein A4X06_0g5812 [Tilletia controversa]KAE8261934.1 hypothetical protein A4X03_0g2858 [Tilletia caries]CAD6892088.1 unnamed protein product [Tilletia caries]CAD6895857.1 unnamed protein product [Tilletia controversa]